jgi:hypothetical protein
VVAVDVGEARGPADADVRVAVAPADEVAVLTALRAIALGGGERVAGQAGAAWDVARELAPVLTGARYLVIVHDAEPSAVAGARGGRAGPLIALAQALNGPTRCALSSLRAGGNRSGADAVLTAQTGYPAAVDFSRGFPRYVPGTATRGRGSRAARWTPRSCSATPAASRRGAGRARRRRVRGDRPARERERARRRRRRARQRRGGHSRGWRGVPHRRRAAPPSAVARPAPPAAAALAAALAERIATLRARRRAARARDGGAGVSALRIVGGRCTTRRTGWTARCATCACATAASWPSLPADAPRLDARGMVVMPGGVDMHCHVASGSVNLRRRLLPGGARRDPAFAPELHDGEPFARSGTGGTVPSTFTTGYRYAGLGYTTVFDAASRRSRPAVARGARRHADRRRRVLRADGQRRVPAAADRGRGARAGARVRAWLLGAPAATRSRS